MNSPSPLYITDAPPYMSHCCTLVTSKRSLFARHAYAPLSENLSQNRDSSVNNTLFLSLIVYRCTQVPDLFCKNRADRLKKRSGTLGIKTILGEMALKLAIGDGQLFNRLKNISTPFCLRLATDYSLTKSDWSPIKSVWQPINSRFTN